MHFYHLFPQYSKILAVEFLKTEHFHKAAHGLGLQKNNWIIIYRNAPLLGFFWQDELQKVTSNANIVVKKCFDLL